MSTGSRVIVAMLLVAVVGAAFWVLALSPKRDEANMLGGEVKELKAVLAQHRAEVREALEAREEFPVNYQQLVVLGKAVPGDDDTASLLVQLNRIARHAGVRFSNFTLSVSEGGAAPAPAPEEGSGADGSEATPATEPVSPTEAAASTLPLGAAIGPAGLAVMPYSLTFDGNFLELADFIKGLDSLVRTTNANVNVEGRLITIGGFSLEAGPSGFPSLKASFSVTTYLTPPSEGVTAGASPVGPSPATATPAATTLGGGS